MADVISLAEQLGQAIADHPAARTYRQARQMVRDDEQVMRTLREYREQAEKIARLEESNEPIEVDDKHRLEQLHRELLASDAFKKFTAAEVEYADLMRQVNQAMGQHLGEIEQPLL